ncbi:hypothetical protein Tco_0371208 [Tanacetum coccineum]
MRANSHHRPLLVAAVALQRGVATTAAVGPAQARPRMEPLEAKDCKVEVFWVLCVSRLNWSKRKRCGALETMKKVQVPCKLLRYEGGYNGKILEYEDHGISDLIGGFSVSRYKGAIIMENINLMENSIIMENIIIMESSIIMESIIIIENSIIMRSSIIMESKDILGVTIQRAIKEILKNYWEILPKETLKRYWEILPK